MANFVADLTAELACEALRSAGVTCSPKDIAVGAREERRAVSLPGERIAWFAASEAGNRRLDLERRVGGRGALDNHVTTLAATAAKLLRRVD